MGSCPPEAVFICRSLGVIEVKARLLDLIERLPVGAMLPDERRLATEWHVARMTLRRAVDELIVVGLLERQHGSDTYTRRT